MLAQCGWRNIQVLDRLARPQRSDDGLWGNSDRSYLLGVSERGQAVLNDLGVMPRVLACSTPLLYRAQWTPQKPEGEGMDRRQLPNRTRPATQVHHIASVCLVYGKARRIRPATSLAPLLLACPCS